MTSVITHRSAYYKQCAVQGSLYSNGEIDTFTYIITHMVLMSAVGIFAQYRLKQYFLSDVAMQKLKTFILYTILMSIFTI